MAQDGSARRAGPPVWLDMDQKALDDAYDQAMYAPNREQVVSRNRFNGARVLARYGEPQRLAYGSSDIEQVELYAADRKDAPIVVYIHGGAWRYRAVRNSAFLAEMFLRAGVHFVAVDYNGVDQTDGDLMPLADQVRRAIAWVHANARSFGGDPDRLYLLGHSSGGHLGGVALTTDWAERGAPADIVKGALLSSGMYDLKPVRLSKRSKYVAFTDEIEEKLSPLRHLDRLNCPLIIGYGTFETPEFQRQSRDFAAALETAGKPVKLLVAEGYNHPEVGEALGNPCSIFGSAFLEMIGKP